MKLLEPLQIGSLQLPNRVVMAPMTRARADAQGLVGPLHATYYAQRASAGLIVSEAVNVSLQGIGSPLTPGIFNAEQVARWHGVTEAVHQAGGRIFAQLWHAGRVGHSLVRGGALPVAPSAIRIEGQKHFTSNGPQDYEVPVALSTEEVRNVVVDFRTAAQNAKDAGFDGIELHSAFGYLPNQFLADNANKRTDEYGGSIENRCRFVMEIMAQLVSVWGPSRVGIRLSPNIPYNGMIDSDPEALYGYLIGRLNELPLAYLHLMQALFPLDKFPTWPKDALATFGPLYKGIVMTNGGYDRDKAETVIAEGRAQLVSFGNAYVANPDLVGRFAKGAALAEPDRATLYGGGEKGFADYPMMSDAG